MLNQFKRYLLTKDQQISNTNIVDRDGDGDSG